MAATREADVRRQVLASLIRSLQQGNEAEARQFLTTLDQARAAERHTLRLTLRDASGPHKSLQKNTQCPEQLYSLCITVKQIRYLGDALAEPGATASDQQQKALQEGPFDALRKNLVRKEILKSASSTRAE